MKKTKTLLFFLLFLFSLKLYCQDKVISKYKSDFEKLIIQKKDSFISNKIGILPLFAIDSTYSLEKAILKKETIDNFLNSLDREKIKNYSKKKKTKFLYKTIHNRFLRKYENVVNFSKIFETGTYNCVSASALYCYVFDSFDIPYQVKETPTHIFLVTYPNELNIYIETTIPGKKGFFSPSEKDIKSTVDELVKSKLVTKEELAASSYEEIFMNFFYDKEYLKPYELIGVQYYNQAVGYLEEEKYEKAFYSFENAEIYYSSKKVKFLKKSSLAAHLETCNFKELDHVEKLVSLINILEYENDFTNKELRYYLYNIINENENNEDFLINSLDIFKSIQNEKVREFVNNEVYFFIARRRFNLGKNLDSILKYALKAYELDKENKILEELITKSILNSFALTTPNKKKLGQLENYEEQFPFLNESSFYIKYMIRVYSYLTGNAYYKKDISLGKIYFENLKEFIDKSKEQELIIDNQIIGEAYWSIGAYYYAKSNLKKAKAFLEEGKKIAPEHNKLNKVLSYVIEDLK